MSLTWLFLGAAIGVIQGRATGRLFGVLCMAVGAMTVLQIPGIILGLLGGDTRGSIAGAAGGLLSCWGAKLGGAFEIQPPDVSLVVIFGALIGATAFLFTRFLVWKYGMILRGIRWLIGLTAATSKPLALAGPCTTSRRLTGHTD
jgi:hypothetical protein